MIWKVPTAPKDPTPILKGGVATYIVRGLENIGNSCYFNSVLQIILATNNLREHYLALGKSKSPVTASLIDLFRSTSLEEGSGDVISPITLFENVSKLHPGYKDKGEEDSHEFFMRFLEILSAEELEESGDVYPTFIQSIFQVELSTTVTCCICETELSPSAPKKNWQLMLNCHKEASVESCLETFTKSHVLPKGSEKVCEKHQSEKREGNSKEKHWISNSPQVLVLFLTDNEQGLDLKSTIQEELTMGDSVMDFSDKKSEVKYQLYGAIKYEGTGKSGHVISFVKGGKEFEDKAEARDWYKISDHIITHVSVTDVMLSGAYILFYCKTV